MQNVTWEKCKAIDGGVETALRHCCDNPVFVAVGNVPTLLSFDDAEEAFRLRLAAADAMPGANLRKDRVELICLTVQAPPQCDAAVLVTSVFDAARQCLDEKNILTWAFHQDAEAGDHMHLIVFPSLNGRLSAKHICTRSVMIRFNNLLCDFLSAFGVLLPQESEIGFLSDSDAADGETPEKPSKTAGGRKYGAGRGVSLARDSLIQKSNYLVMSFYGTMGKKQADPAELYQYNLTALRMLDVYLSKIDSDNPSSRYVEFTKNEFCEIMGLHEKTTTAGLVAAVKQLKYVDVIFPVQYADKSGIAMMTLFPNARLTNENRGGKITIALECNERLMDLFFDLEKGDYTTYALENILRLKSKYAFVLYNRLKMHLYQNGSRWIATPHELGKLFDVEIPANTKYLNRILKRCQEEINEQTDISFEYETLQNWRNTMALRFDIVAKTGHPELAAT